MLRCLAAGASVLGASAFVPIQPASDAIVEVAPASAGLRGSVQPQSNPGTSTIAYGLVGTGCVAVAAAATRQTKKARNGRAATSKISRQYDASQEIGVIDPLLFWDPIGFCDGCSKEEFDRRRAVELKHGRVCMFATIGMVAPDLFGKWGGELSPSAGLKFADIPSGIAAVGKVPAEGWLQIVIFAGVLELFYFKDLAVGGPNLGQYGSEPGNFGTGYWGRKIQDPVERKNKLNIELANGRLAMVAFTAMAVQNFLTGQSTIDQIQSGHISPFNDGQGLFAQTSNTSQSLPWAPVPAGLTNDPLRGEYVGDVGFDPLGLSTNRKLLPWYREAELAHGRVAMMATLGYTVQVSGLKIEPFLTKYPTSSEDPLLAATQVPLGGWLQIILLITFVEVWRYKNVIAADGVAPGDLGWNVQAPVKGQRPQWIGPTFSAAYSEEEFKLMQLREIKHARFAMLSWAVMTIINAETGKGVSIIPIFERPEYAGTVGDFIPRGI